MSNKNIEERHHKAFEELKQVTESNGEFWYARDLQVALDYSRWDKFKRVIQKAVLACGNSGQESDNHFSQVEKMVKLGSGSQREIQDAKGIHASKGLKKSQQILDNMGSTELAANLFRTTQTEEKLRRENIQGKSKANKTHFEVGKKVCQTIEELGGTMPEDLPTPDEDLKKLEKRVKTQKKLKNDEV